MAYGYNDTTLMLIALCLLSGVWVAFKAYRALGVAVGLSSAGLSIITLTVILTTFGSHPPIG